MSIFKGKTLMITGGTGSFGNMALKRFLNTDIAAIKIFSRDENKQDNMRRYYQNDKIQFHIGDVRDFQSVKSAMYGVDYIFHAAALKQVPSCEFFPIEAVKTNVLGTENVLNAAIEMGVKKIVCLSTDKAAYPINAMGTSKAMMEKVLFAKSRTVPEEKITICCTRYGNVMCSRGSVIPLFIDQIKNNQPMTVTNPNMTRFLMDMNEAFDLVLFAFNHGRTGDLFIRKSPACTIATLVEAVKKIFNPAAKVREIGIRHGEKMFETLMTSEERIKSEDLGNYFRVPLDSRNLNYEKYFSGGSSEILQTEPYTSANTEQLDVESAAKKILAVDYVQEYLSGRSRFEIY